MEKAQMDIAVYLLLATLGLIVLLSALAPSKVEYTEKITVDAPVDQVYDDIRLQEHLMRWSAWPKETKSTCTVEGTDGEVGTRTVFFTKGKQVGHQEVMRLITNEEVALTLVGPGPPHKPKLTFKLSGDSEGRTQVMAHFVNELPRPFNAVWKFAGLTKWTRQMHRKDLAGLKAFSEPPHRDMNGEVVGRPPKGVNPFEHNKQAA